jgi:tetratricopeptide (TPR) repeat protein
VIRDAVAELERGASAAAILRSLEAERQGQLALDFQPVRAAERAPAKVLSLRAPEPAAQEAPSTRAQDIAAANQALAAKYFLEGAELDDGENRDLTAAAGAYRRAALFDPHLVPAVVNLANIYYERDELVEAEALYEKAIRLDVECFEAYFNLGNIPPRSRPLPGSARSLSRRAHHQSRIPGSALLSGGDAGEARSIGGRPSPLAAIPRLGARRRVVALATEFSDTKD